MLTARAGPGVCRRLTDRADDTLELRPADVSGFSASPGCLCVERQGVAWCGTCLALAACSMSRELTVWMMA